jgi:hypothetical protein
LAAVLGTKTIDQEGHTTGIAVHGEGPLEEPQVFVRYNGWTVFNYVGWMTVREDTVANDFYRCGLTHDTSEQTKDIQYAITTAINWAKGVLCFLVRDRRVTDLILLHIINDVSRLVGGDYQFSIVELSRRDREELSRRYEERGYLARVLTQPMDEGRVTFRGIKKPVLEMREVVEADSVFETKRTLSRGSWLSITVRVNDVGYQLQLSRRSAAVRHLTINSLGLHDHLPREKAAKYVEHVAGMLLLVKAPYALRAHLVPG